MEVVLLVDFFRPTAAFFTAVGDPKPIPKFSVADLRSDLSTRVDWLSESVKDKTATVGIKRTFFSSLATSLLWLVDLIPRSVKCLRGTGVITNQLCRHPLSRWRTFHKNEEKVSRETFSVSDLSVNWRSDLFTGQFTGLLKCSHTDLVPPDHHLLAQWCQVNHQHSQLESSSFLGFPSSGPVYYPLSTLFSPDWRVKSLSGNNTFGLWLIGKGKSHKKWALNGDDPVDCKNYLWRLLNNQKLQFVFSICSQGKVIWFISVKCWRDESQSNKSHFSNLSLHIREGIISLHLKGLFLFFSRQHSIT